MLASCAFLLALTVTICIAAAVPAIGVYGVMNLTPLDFPNIVDTGYPGGYADTLGLRRCCETAAYACWISLKWPVF